MLRLTLDAMPVNQRETDTGVVCRNPRAACRLARENSATPSEIGDLRRHCRKPVPFFVAVHGEIESPRIWEERNGAHQSANGQDSAASGYCRQFRQSVINEVGACLCYDAAANMRNVFLGIWRALAVTFFSLCALAENAITIPFFARTQRLHARARWLHRWSRFASGGVGIHVTTRGSMPLSGLLVCNHLSYLDVIVLSSIRPCVFVAKLDVAAWPFFGWLARAAGTIFVDREHRLSSTAVIDLVHDAIRGGSVVVLFPEGTSSDGATVLPFKSALLESAVQLRCPVTAACIDYAIDRGSVSDEVCYGRDMTLVPHLLNLFFKHEIRSNCVFALAKTRSGNRKQIARELREEIV